MATKTTSEPRLSKKDKRELELFSELQEKYGYCVFALKKKDERFPMHFKSKGKKLVHTPAVAMKLVVHENSVMGREMKKLYGSIIGREDKKKPRAR